MVIVNGIALTEREHRAYLILNALSEQQTKVLNNLSDNQEKCVLEALNAADNAGGDSYRPCSGQMVLLRDMQQELEGNQRRTLSQAALLAHKRQIDGDPLTWQQHRSIENDRDNSCGVDDIPDESDDDNQEAE